MDTLATSQKLKLSGLSSKHTEAIANNESIEIKLMGIIYIVTQS